MGYFEGRPRFTSRGCSVPTESTEAVLASPRNGVLVSLQPLSAGNCAVNEAVGNHLISAKNSSPQSAGNCAVNEAAGTPLHRILRQMAHLSLLRKTAKAFKAIGGYCIGTVIKDNAIAKTVAYLKKPGHMLLGITHMEISSQPPEQHKGNGWCIRSGSSVVPSRT
ncbi:hypothetical protein ElyMa_003404200 [Elysia marginata]|uniref:Uncharacterized protein n=1 Tax=Elysia marginata TaxID=1093978 RepID=A0AAV4JR76_9GAST|nr:hypothetical protein ElyMa_003404200 [Elysia marginata]